MSNTCTVKSEANKSRVKKRATAIVTVAHDDGGATRRCNSVFSVRMEVYNTYCLEQCTHSLSSAPARQSWRTIALLVVCNAETVESTVYRPSMPLRTKSPTHCATRASPSRVRARKFRANTTSTSVQRPSSFPRLWKTFGIFNRFRSN